MSDYDGKFFVFKSSDGESSKIQINYDFADSCLLGESQLNIYRDNIFNDVGTSYNNPFRIKLNNLYSVKEFENVFGKLFDIFPVLSARIIRDGDEVFFRFDSDPQIIVGSCDDVGSFVSPFNLDESLSKFLIVENDGVTYLYVDLHELIFDYSSLNIIVDNLLTLLDGKDVDYDDDGVLRQFSLEDYMVDSKYKRNVENAYESILSDYDSVSDLLPSIKMEENSDFRYNSSFSIDLDYFNRFLDDYSISPDQFFACVFAYTLSRFTESSKVLFDWAVDIRDQMDSLYSLGNFTYHLPLIFDCENQSVDSYLDYSLKSFNSSYDYIFYPFGILKDKFGLNSNIQFQFTSKTYDVIEELSHDFFYELSFYISCDDDGVVDIKVLYSDKYSFEFIERFVGVYKSILLNMMCVDDLAHIDYISSSDLDLLDSYNDTDAILNYGDVLEAFNDNLSKYPDNNLVLYKDRSYSYGEGAFIADKIAKQLVKLGINSQDSVAFLTERCEYYMFCVLGVLSVGGVYVPLDDKQPDERIKFILEDTDSSVVIVTDETYDRASALTDKVLFNISDIFKGDIGCIDYLPVVYSDLASVFYTSGSTGVSKGVKIPRKALIYWVENYIRRYGFDEKDVYGLFSTISFSVCNFPINLVISSGGCLDVVPDDIRYDMLELNEYFIGHNVSHTFITTQVGKLFVESVDDTSLDVLLVGGEKLGDFVSFREFRFVECYGMTEFGFVACIDNVEKLDSSSVGFINSNVKVYVLDDELRRVPVGAVGELCISGYQLAEGYLNRDVETDYAFINNPYDDCEGFNRLYRTGDMVRFLPDGSLALVGRRDSQFKIRGNRVELSEVEGVIREVDSVDDVTVQTVKNGFNNELVAYVVSIDNTLTVNGKVDKRALPEVDVESLHGEYVAPRSEVETLIIDAFENVLNQKGIGLFDDFVHLGGDSLTAIQVISFLQKNYVSCSARDILIYKTPYLIAQNLELYDENINYDSIQGEIDLSTIQSFFLDKIQNYDNHESIVCCLSESQMGVYLDEMVNDKNIAYSTAMTYECDLSCSVEEIKNVIFSIIDKHPILKGRIINDGEDVFLVCDSYPLVEVVGSDDTSSLVRPFDLEDYLARFYIIDTTDRKAIFFDIHHIISDATTLSIIEEELNDGFEGILDDELDLGFVYSCYDDYMIKFDSSYEDAHRFFADILSDVDDIDGLLDDVDGSDGSVILPIHGVRDKIEKFAYDKGITAGNLFYSVFAYCLSRFTGNSRVSFNILENGRHKVYVQDSVGMFVRTTPVVIDSKDLSVDDYVCYVSDLVLESMGNNFYPFRLLASEFNLNNDIAFEYNYDLNDMSFVDNEVIVIDDVSDRVSEFLCTVNDLEDGYSVTISHSNKYSQQTAKHFVYAFKEILTQILERVNMGDIDYVSSEDLELLDSYNDTGCDFEYDDVLDAFNDNLKKYEHNVLVGYKDKSFTFGESAFIANEIAGHLENMGLARQDFIALFVERSEWFLLSCLGVLSMGGVYVPIDIDYPDERIVLMLKDTDSKVVLVSDETEERMCEIISDNGLDIDVLNLDTFEDDIGSLSHLDNVSVDVDDVACVLYTSGTTGIPKGVLVIILFYGM